MPQRKTAALIFLGLLVLLFLILAASLRNLQLQPGQAFSLASPFETGAAGTQTGGGSQILLWLLRILGALVILVLPLAIYAAIRSPEGRKRLIANIIAIVVVLLLSDYFRKMVQSPVEAPATAAGPVEGTPAISSAPLAQLTSAPPDWLVAPVLVAGSALLVGLGVFFIRLIIRQPKPAPTLLDTLGEQAQSAADQVRKGIDVENAIIRCYLDMTRVVQEERGLNRGADVTPREFEYFLENKGLPLEPLRMLTWLFEEVRYGQRKPNRQEEEWAANCLEAIAAACRRVISAKREAA